MPRSCRTVLVIDDASQNHDDYEHQLQQDIAFSYHLLVEQYDTSIPALCRSQRIDCILLDLYSSYTKQLTVLSQLKQAMGEECPPIVVIGGEDAEIAVQAFKQGAVDYLVKERMTWEDLRLTMRSAIENAELRQELQRSQERFHTSVENMLDCYGIFSSMRDESGQIVDFRIDYLNQAACDNNRMSKADQIGRGLCEILPAHRETGLFDDYCRVVETGEPLIKDSLIYEDTYAGQRLARAFEIRASKLNDGFVASWRDITEQKHTEATLRANQAQLQQQLVELEALYQSAPIGLAVLDRNLRFVRINQRLAEINGFPVEAHLGQTVRELLPDLAETAEQLLYPVLETGEPLFDVEIQGETPAQPGVQRIWLERFLPLKDGDRVTGISIVCEEITERQQAEEALQQSKGQLLLGMQVTGFALAQVDYAANTIKLSPEAAVLYGLPPDQLVVPRERVHATFHPEEQAELARIIEQVLDPSGTGWFAHDHRVVWQTGEVRWLTVRKQIFFDRTQTPAKPTSAILVALDITERKQAEQEREQLLVQEQAAREAAERANRVKDEFLAILSHELRSPLNPILGWSTLLQARPFDAARTAEALATIERNAKLQMQLIDDLLDIAKILRGKLTLNPAPVNLTEIIRAAIETVRTAATAKSIVLHIEFPDQIEQVMGDAARLQQIVWNLLSNAIKFTSNGGQVHIRLITVDQEAELTVTDTGKGINPDFLPYLFESFQQEDTSTTRRYGGLGLGLAIVRQLVEAHGGTIAAHSLGEGQGATFTVRLPLLNTSAERPSAVELPTPELDLAGIRVLAVDDDPDSRELLTFLLSEYGAEITTVTSAVEVLAMLESCQPDILVSDIGMPEMDGYALIQQIRSRPPEQGGQVKAIALTAYAREGDYQRALASGYQRHVTKPLDPKQLVQAIVTLVMP